MKRSVAIILAVVAVLALFGAIALQSVETTVFSKDFHLYEQEKIYNAQQTDLTKEDLQQKALDVVDFLKGNNEKINNVGVNSDELLALNRIKNALDTVAVVKYVLIAVFLVAGTVLVFVNKVKGLKTLTISYVIGCGVIGLIIGVILLLGVFEKQIIPLIKPHYGILPVLYTKQFFIDCGYRVLRVFGTISIILAIISLGIIFWRKPTDDRDNYLYQ